MSHSEPALSADRLVSESPVEMKMLSEGLSYRIPSELWRNKFSMTKRK
ncbi:MAG TPA: hypothetical protein VGA29_08635 [Ignavibacteriaceae bacterium]